MKKLMVFLVLTFVAIAAKAEVVRIYAMDALTLQIDLTKPTSDPAYVDAQTPANQTVQTAGTYPWSIYRTFLRYDLSSIPDNAVVTGALMHMTVYGSPWTQEGELQLAERMSFDAWDDNEVNQEGYVGSTVTQLSQAVRLLSANNTVTWNLDITRWDYALDIADNVLTMQVRYLNEGDYSYKGTGYYSHDAGWTENEWPYLELTVVPGCPSLDLSGDCKVNLVDFSQLAYQWLTIYDETDLVAMAAQWQTEGILAITWVPVCEAGFTGQMSKYETTNFQYCQFLNAALASGDITVGGDYVAGASGSNSGQDFAGWYYYLAGSGSGIDGAADGGAARINWTGSSFTVDAGFENHPVTYVSWCGATAFASYYGWRLPTEEEWQAVADFDGTYAYGCGTAINNGIANYLGSHHPHGTTAACAFGVYGYGMADMAGNVGEWTSSCFYPDCSYGFLVYRGGVWDDRANSCSVGYRLISTSGYMSNDLGFRVCR